MQAYVKIAATAVFLILGMLSISARAAYAESCNIKGNVSTKGERIYHLPGQRYYEDTVIQSSHGEQWFCSEEQARAAGWRRSKV